MPPASTVHPAATVHLLFDVVPCLFQFLFFPILSLVIDFGFIFFFVISLALSRI